MIFSAEECRLILTGRKTEARRIAVSRPGLLEPSLSLSINERKRATTHQVGNVYRLERFARGDELRPEERMQLETGVKRHSRPRVVVAHVICRSVDLQRAGDIDMHAARAEGFKTTDDFKTAWVTSRRRGRLRGAPAPEDDVAWRVRRMARGIHDHRLSLPVCACDACDAPVAWFDAHEAERLVWTLALEVCEAPRLMARASAQDDYTDLLSKSANEPEPLTEEELVALTRFAPARDHARRREGPAEHAENMARELEELRIRAVEDGLADAGLRTLLLAADRNIERIKERLGRAA